MRYVNSPAAAARTYLTVCADIYWVQVMATAISIWMVCVCRPRRDHAVPCR